MKIPLKVMDMFLAAAALGIVAVFAFKVYASPVDTAQVLINGTGREWIFPLDAEETVLVPGPLGNTVVKIHNNVVTVEQSPCANQICVAQGNIHRQGGWTACLPNGVFILIEGVRGSKDEPDAMAW